jgi:hypothetical protein
METPVNTPEGQPVYLNILEEVTGLAISAQIFPMQMEDNRHYSLSLPFPVGSVVKYRYSRKGPAAQVEEHISDGRQVRYRLYQVNGPGMVQDVVTRWTDTTFEGQTGRILGQVRDGASGQSLPNVLVAAGGVQALTASDGSYLLEGLPPGTHNLVAYSLDGSYRTFQQGARIEALSTTPAPISLSSAPMVSLVLVISVPQDTIPAIPIRIAGNLYQLGNTFANLSGGVSTIASRMPVLNILPDGRYTITLNLPAGADIHYLYTLGDGLWNTEKTSAGSSRIRQLIVPETSTQIDDTVESWISGDTAPITFDVTVPANTPAEDIISIQFNPLFGWTEPIPMWRLEENRWAYVLNSLPAMMGKFHYRFCRNGQCGSADDRQTMGMNNTGFPFTSSLLPQRIIETVDTWAWLDNPGTAPDPPQPVAVRGTSFMAGSELQAAFHPSWIGRTQTTLDLVQSMGANWLVLTPTWTFTREAPPVLEIVTGRDPLWIDLTATIQQARDRGLNTAIFPTPHFSTTPEEWWAGSSRDFPWWVAWFDRYRNFLLHHADLASRSDAQALILGGEWLGPALPGGALADGSASGVPVDAEDRWRTLIQEVRTRYSGPIFWALPYSLASGNPPPFLDSVDQIYILFSEKLSDQPNPAPAVLEAEAARLIDAGLLPLQSRFNKPVVLAAAYPSADGANTACLANPSGGCLSLDALARPNPDIPEIQLDLQEQADIYNALFVAVNQRTWISGFVNRGGYPPAILLDKSTSVHGKPAQDVITYWFPRLLGAVSP